MILGALVIVTLLVCLRLKALNIVEGVIQFVKTVSGLIITSVLDAAQDSCTLTILPAIPSVSLKTVLLSTTTATLAINHVSNAQALK